MPGCVLMLALGLSAPARADDAVTFAEVLGAVSKAPGTQIGAHEIAAADALVDAAGAWPSPSLHIDTNRLTAHVVAGASIPLPVFGTVGAARREAAARARVVRSDGAIAVREVRHRAAIAWLALARADGEATANADTVRQATELERIAKSKLDAGSGAEVDVTSARAARVRAELSVVASVHARAAAAAELAGILGWDPARVIHAAGDVPIGSPTAIDALRARLSAHPDRAAALLRVAAADAAVGGVRAHRIPSITLDGQVSLDDPTQPGTDVLVGLTLELPVFSKIGAQARSARATAAAERMRLVVTETQLAGVLIASYHRWQSASDRFNGLVRDVVPLQEKATAQSEQAYREGARELVTALQAERDLASVRAEVNAARIDAGVAWVELQLAAGTELDAR